MTNQILLYSGAALPVLWGVAHLFPTRSVVKGFGEISEDNKRIITMEWITEGIALIFIGFIVFIAAYIDHKSNISQGIFWISFVTLNVLSLVSISTGFKVRMIPFKLCPVIFSSASVLILLGYYL